MGITGSRDEDGAGMAYVRCNDGTIWLDTGNATVPWRQLPAIPEPTDEELDALEWAEQEEREEGLRQHEALQEAVRANQERLWEERKEAERLAMEVPRREPTKEVERLAPIRPWWLW